MIDCRASAGVFPTLDNNNYKKHYKYNDFRSPLVQIEMLIKDSEFTQVTLENRLGQSVDAEVLCHRNGDIDLVVIRSPDQVSARRLAKNAEYFARQLLALCKSTTERLQIVEWRQAEEQATLWRWHFSWVGQCPITAKAAPVKAGHHKLINGILSSLTIAAA